MLQASRFVARLVRQVSHLAGRRCQLCAAILPESGLDLLCESCARLLAPRQGGFCPSCGICFADSAAPIYPCLSCRTSPPPWSRVAFHSPYAGVLKDLVHRHKFVCDHGVTRVLGELLYEAWRVHGLDTPDLIVPVPMRSGRLVRRGFNQSAELARILARRIGVSVSVDALFKTRDTAAQSSLGRADRLRNVAGAFQASPRLAGRKVLLVDDVMTTGSTVTACAWACLGAGAAGVDVVVLGRAL